MKIGPSSFLLLAAFLLAVPQARAQDSTGDAAGYPNGTVRIVVAVSAGSFSDIMARILADRLGKIWKENVVVENRPGLPGITSVAKATPDGYTLFINSNGHSVAAILNKNVQFDPVKDFAGVTRVATVPLVLAVPPELPVATLSEFLDYVRQRPGQLNFSSAGVASTSFLSGEVLLQQSSLSMQHVPYRGAPEALNAVMRGDAQMYTAVTIPQARELAAAGKIKVLAINTEARAPELPDVPTFAEAGLPNYKYDSWFGMFLQAGTPRAIVDKVNRDMRTALEDPEVVRALRNQGFLAAPTTAAEFDAMNKGDAERYEAVLRRAGVAQ